ncbi:glycosyltransferase [Geobacter sp. FeAm09]|uniref:glycosyltransferase n=1 Tax=Geobacter sp. FeAm09 TaxID=2597769 RepID=UPI0011ECE5C1|nr:glycosyltransferase [Geobacter sp. FeAm09]QEM67236.1 glycosyltransferase [Geobacter sp. FeAm09]
MIIACEPVCHGFEHALVNAAVLSVVAEAFPGQELLFLADEGHIGYVASDPIISTRGGVAFEPLALPARKSSGSERFKHEFSMVAALFAMAEQRGASLVVFTCISDETLRAIKLLAAKFPKLKCVAVLHGVLASVLKRPSLFPWKNRNTFRTWFLKQNSPQLTYILMGDSIERELVARFPEMRPYVASIDLPYRFAPPCEHEPFGDRTVTFGSLGVIRKAKGSDAFLRLANEVAASRHSWQPRFVCVGPVVDKKLRKLLGPAVTVPSPDAPLSADEFALHARQLDYAVFLHGADAYTLTASGALFDAFSYLKPLIALRNPFFTSYFEKMGNIGYLCDSYEDVRRTVMEILDNPPLDEYMLQRQALLKGRERLQVGALAATLRAKLA